MTGNVVYMNGRFLEEGSNMVKAACSSKAPTDKFLVYWLWHKVNRKMMVEELLKAVDNRIKRSSVKAWISAWKNGENIPKYQPQ